MPNQSTSNTNSIYKYSASMTLAFDENDVIKLNSLYIKGIVIDYNYDENNFPLLYVTVAVPYNIKEKLIANQSTGTVIFTIKKFIVNGDFPGLLIDYIEDKFVYFMPNSASDTYEAYKIENPEGSEDISKVYTIGLISLNHINKSKKSINGIVKKGSKSSVIYYILKEHNLLMEPLQYNSIMNSMILPPMGSVSSALKYFNDLEVFYDTPYRFFMDFDVTYLMSSSGKLIPKKGSTLNNVIINIRDTFDEANMEGMVTNKELGAYIINASASFCSIIDSSINDKGYNKLYASTTSGKGEDATISDVSKSEITEKTSSIRLPNGNSKLLKNIEGKNKLNIISLSISIAKIDTSIITMDKIYTINADDTYGTQYTGNYLLVRKQEVYTPEGDGLALNLSMLFKKIPS